MRLDWLSDFTLREVMVFCAALFCSHGIWAEEPQLRQPSKYGDVEVGYRGLTCRQCMYTLIDYCPNIPKADAIGIVRATKPSATQRECAAPGGYSEYVPCRNAALHQFDFIRFLKNVDGAAKKEDVFVAEYESDLNDRERKTGVLLDPSKAYLIIVARRSQQASPKADWTINFACEIPSADLNRDTDK